MEDEPLNDGRGKERIRAASMLRMIRRLLAAAFLTNTSMVSAQMPGAASASQLVASDFATTMVEATYKLYHKNSTGTCFLVRRDDPDKALYLITAAHVLERTKGGTAIVVLRERGDDGACKRHDHTVPIRRDDKPLWVRHPKEDVAVLRLNDPPPVPAAALRLDDLADEARLEKAGLHPCSGLFVLTYPQRFEANEAGFSVARSGIIASHPLLPVERHPTFLADFTTFAGDSGGPVFVESAARRPLVLGIVLSQYRHDEKLTMEYEERTIHHPLGLGAALHSRFVRDTIERAAGEPPRSAQERPDDPRE